MVVIGEGLLVTGVTEDLEDLLVSVEHLLEDLLGCASSVFYLSNASCSSI